MLGVTVPYLGNAPRCSGERTCEADVHRFVLLRLRGKIW